MRESVPAEEHVLHALERLDALRGDHRHLITEERMTAWVQQATGCRWRRTGTST